MASKTTKDELFLLKLLELSENKGSPFEEIDAYTIGRAIGQNDRGVITIIRHLAQTNFIKKGEGMLIHLTPHGLALTKSLREERGK